MKSFFKRLFSSASHSTEIPEPETNRWEKPKDEPLFIAVSQKDEKMAAAYKRAKATFPEFLTSSKKDFFAGATTSVKIRIKDIEFSKELGEDRFVYIWVYNISEASEGIKATVIELPKGGINDLKEGSDLFISEDEIYDWMIYMNAKAWGGFTLRVVRDSLPDHEKAQYDTYSGITAFIDELP